MRRTTLVLFFIACTTEIASHIFDLQSVHQIAKPTLMILLGLYYFTSTSGGYRSNVVLAALFFSFLGDTFLLFDKDNSLYFMLGLGAFLVAHIFYIVAFRQERYEENHDSLQRVQKLRIAFPVILAATGLVVVLYPNLGDLRVPVIAYATVIMFMVLNALFRFERTNARSFWMVAAGAILFMLSDSMLAINKFLEPIKYAGVWIMLTYLAAQLFIVDGILRHGRASK